MISTSFAFDINNLNNTTMPDMVYIDTCSILDIAIQRRNGQATEQFLNNLHSNGGIITWSQFTLEELTNFFHTNEYISYARNNNISDFRTKKAWKVAEDIVSNSVSSTLAQQVMNKVSSVTSYLEQFGTQTYVNENEFVPLTNKIYQTYGGNQQDSRHVAIANLTGINNILTADSGFLRYPNTNVYGTTTNIVNNCNNTNTPSNYINLNEIL